MNRVYFGGNKYSDGTVLIQVVFNLDKDTIIEGEYQQSKYSFPFDDYRKIARGLRLLGKTIVRVTTSSNVDYDGECNEHLCLTDEETGELYSYLSFSNEELYLKRNRWWVDFNGKLLKMPVDMCDRETMLDNKKTLTLNLYVKDVGEII